MTEGLGLHTHGLHAPEGSAWQDLGGGPHTEAECTWGQVTTAISPSLAPSRPSSPALTPCCFLKLPIPYSPKDCSCWGTAGDAHLPLSRNGSLFRLQSQPTDHGSRSLQSGSSLPTRRQRSSDRARIRSSQIPDLAPGRGVWLAPVASMVSGARSKPRQTSSLVWGHLDQSSLHGPGTGVPHTQSQLGLIRGRCPSWGRVSGGNPEENLSPVC
jgi:hypothetical protein